MAEPTDKEMQNLYENFETHDLLDAVDLVDELRDHLNDREDGAPPELRDDLLKLHGLAMAVVNHGDKAKAQALFDLATDLQDQVQDMRRAIEEIEESLDGLCKLYPESLSYE